MLALSIWRKLIVTCLAAGGFVLVYQATIQDSRSAAELELAREATAAPAPGARLRFTATAYCKGDTTASGVAVRRGIAAADPDLLPVGSVIDIQTRDPRYDGIYTIMDTGPKVQGRHVDLYMWSCHEALKFGKRSLQLTVLRLGWNPRSSTADQNQRAVRQRESQAPAPPLPATPAPLLEIPREPQQ